MDNPTLEPSDILYGSTDSDASDSTTDEVITETTAEEDHPTEGVELEVEESELAEDEQIEGDDDQEESLYIDLDGEEVSLDDVKVWKDGHLMQEDYSRKTMALSDERKVLETEKAEVSNQSESLKLLAAELEAVIGSEDEVNMTELREDDPDEYIKLTERNAKREKLLNKAKESLTANTPVSNVDVAVEQKQLVENNPQWVDSKGQATAEYKTDMAALDTYRQNDRKQPFGQLWNLFYPGKWNSFPDPY